MASTVALKIGFKGEIHRIRIDLPAFGYDDLVALFEATFQLPLSTFALQYKTQDATFASVASAADFDAACAAQASAGSLRFFAVSKTEATLHENVSEGIRKALATISGALDKVKHEPWVQDTGAAINHAYTKTFEESKSTLASAKKSLQDIEVDKLMEETKVNLRTVATGVSAYAQDLVESLQKKPAAAETTAPPPVDAKWTYQLATIRDILPDAADDVAIAALERANGDVQVALNEIMSA
ncbi:hypothetical protein SDRG_07426 [Saprolegnia diclina VS20]|uniref:PB1 domain-containing protein n=1 Tax=Saprolegnia diclina (strain VS20) TaxID=1156394 RepID=T0RXV2_SAPDV|nr:hypothetical protein SDRG_07426 [Saprolegnia diclina VS20]EQC35197.1 hypothetical protein SDRG_07426 [Saprolegnia diclina VS20]|eukprot:XP_008611481.1 hypothetical protein SDRG_07426 [Saprolegnia diclina VS20]